MLFFMLDTVGSFDTCSSKNSFNNYEYLILDI